jgi:predicted ribosomally synthesized peptide with nif11-like leader
MVVHSQKGPPMSVQRAKDFLVKVSTDTATADKARQAHESALLAVAQQEGFDISAEDLRAALSEVSVLDDLAVDDADAVVGGFTGRDSLRVQMF